jgi:hypothetical protein
VPLLGLVKDGTEDDDPEGRILGVVRYIAQRVWD